MNANLERRRWLTGGSWYQAYIEIQSMSLGQDSSRVSYSDGESFTHVDGLMPSCHHLFNPPKAFPSFLTRITSLKVRLTLRSLAAWPSAKGVRSPNNAQLAMLSLPRLSSIITSLIPCKQSVYSVPVVISKLLGSCSTLQPCALPMYSLVVSFTFGLISSTI